MNMKTIREKKSEREIIDIWQLKVMKRKIDRKNSL